MDHDFNYSLAFSRNIGWVTESEQDIIRAKRVAIAGLGGVGGNHFLTLTRLGIGAFNIADLDSFELANFNRQAGASMSHVGRPKVDVLAESALDINPELEIHRFPNGVNRDNLKDFFTDVDLYLDGLDFFALAARRDVFGACTELGIPAVTAAPLGMGAALLNFLPGKMTFEEYFRLEGQSEAEQLLRFLLGLSPAMLQMRYLVDPSRVDLPNHRGPSTPMACDICAGVAATQALKILLRRGKVPAAPRGLHFDAYRNRLVKTWRLWGNRNPIQRLALAVGRPKFTKQLAQLANRSADMQPRSVVEKILDLARWAPSGDNMQTWRFEIKDEHYVVVYGYDTRDHCVYDLRGRASQLGLGTLLENLTIAATEHGLCTEIQRRPDAPETQPTFDVRFVADSSLHRDALMPYIPGRATQRRPMRMRSLTTHEKKALEGAVGSAFSIYWIDGLRSRLRVAHLLFMNGKLRLTLPEAYETHRSIMEWNAQFSEDRIPDQAVGLDPVSTKLMRWALKSWSRVKFLNTYLGGTLLPRLQLDFIPAITCAAHFVLCAEKPAKTMDDYLEAGRRLQRFWLTVTQLGLWLQPEMTPLIFSTYVRDGVEFSQCEPSMRLAERLATELDSILPPEVHSRAVFLGRIGSGPAPAARSLRLPLDRLVIAKEETP